MFSLGLRLNIFLKRIIPDPPGKNTFLKDIQLLPRRWKVYFIPVTAKVCFKTNAMSQNIREYWIGKFYLYVSISH